MKLQARFYAKDGRLYSLAGEEWHAASAPVVQAADGMAGAAPSAPARTPVCVHVPWRLVGQDEGSYNEQFLAALRDWLKEAEAHGCYAIIEPDAAPDSPGGQDAFIASYTHCARRIKDCASVIGFALPSGADADAFMAALSRKHAHYLFFSRQAAPRPEIVRL